MKHWIAAAVLLAGALGPVSAQSELPPPFPRVNATPLLENDRIRVWDIVWPKGQPTALHRHIYDQVGTYYVSGGRRITQPDGTVRSNVTEIGSLSTTKKGTTHIEEGTTDPPLRAVFIELKRDGASGPSSGAATAPFPTQGMKPVLDDERVTVWDTTWSSGDRFTYRAARETVIVFLGDGTLRSLPVAGAPAETTVKPGTTRYLPSASGERLEIASGSPRTMFFQIK